MAKSKTKIHPLLRLALAVVVWWGTRELVRFGLGYVINQVRLESWMSTLAGDLLMNTLVGSLLTNALLLLVMRYLVFFTRVRFRDTTLRMIWAMSIQSVVQTLTTYALRAWELRHIVMLFPSDSVVVAAVLYAAMVVLGVLAWTLCASCVKNRSGYFVPILLGVMGALLGMRVQNESVSVLVLNVSLFRDSQWVQLLDWLPTAAFFLGLLLSQWCILYKGQLDTRFGGGTDYSHGTVGNAGMRRSASGGSGHSGHAGSGRSGSTGGGSSTPDFSGYSGLTEADMDRYWQEDASPAPAAAPSHTPDRPTLQETDLTREFAEAMRQEGHSLDAAERLLRSAPRNFE